MINTKAYIETLLKIRDKKARIIPFKINKAQQKVYDAVKTQYEEGKPVRIIILKARQMGFSTLAEALIFKDTATKTNITSGIVAHERDATDNLFRMTKRYYDNLEDWAKPEIKASNAKELIFDYAEGASSVKCMTAGNENIGRSATFQNLHISEYAFWGARKSETLLGLLQAVPNESDTTVIIESTANGYDDFKDRWDKAVRGESDYIPIFCAWWEHPEYRLELNGEMEHTKEEKELKRLYNLDDEQLNWRRRCISNNCNGDINKFKQEYPSCAEEAFIQSGRPVFDTEIIAARIAELEQQYKITPPKRGVFAYSWQNTETNDLIDDYSISFRDDKNGYITIYEQPKKGYPYVIAGDTKGEGRDYFAATVIDNTNGQRVATLHMQVQESRPFTYQMYCLGRYYNDALIGIEVNFNTAPIDELERLRYPRQFQRVTYDTYTKKAQKKFGFRTDGKTRPIIIDKEVGLIKEHIELFKDIPTLREAMTFVYDEKNRPDAIAGKHDDLLFSDMIANEIRGQQTTKPEIITEKEKRRQAAEQYEYDSYIEYGYDD